MADGIVGVKHPYTLAMHDSHAADGERNVHVHLMFSERQLDGIERGPEQFFKRAAAPYRHRVTKEMMPADPTKGGAAKDRAMNGKTFVTDVRARYERVVNAELERAGVDARISMKANPRQEPEPKLGPAHQRADFNVARDARLERVRELRTARAEWKAGLLSIRRCGARFSTCRAISRPPRPSANNDAKLRACGPRRPSCR